MSFRKKPTSAAFRRSPNICYRRGSAATINKRGGSLQPISHTTPKHSPTVRNSINGLFREQLTEAKEKIPMVKRCW
jgi:hypothetical protein